MKAHQIPLREIRDFIRSELSPPDGSTIDVWWKDGRFLYTILIPGQFKPFGLGQVLCDGDMEVVPGKSIEEVTD
jgi:hypothetical protein